MFTLTEGIVQTYPVYTLSGPDLTISVDLYHGMNVPSLSYKGQELLYFDAIQMQKGALRGAPILFPTPNRIRDNVFLFNGKRSQAIMHGQARRNPFTFVKAKVDDTSCMITGNLVLGCDAVPYDYPSDLSVTITVTQKSVSWNYTVTNKAERPLGYGFAIHPLFLKKEGMKIVSDVSYAMEADNDLLPTGKLIPVASTADDFSEGKTVFDLSLDKVFTSLGNAVKSQIRYSDFTLSIEGSEQFTHTVVYTRQELPYVCLEPQSCSTDCHNLYERGYGKESGLTIVRGGEQDCGRITFYFS